MKHMTQYSNPSDREMVFVRVFDAPRELVYEAWTNPKHVAQWWGPAGFTNTIHEMNVTKGGVWRLTMHGPDGVDYPNKIVFTEVVAPKLLIYQHEGDAGIRFKVTVNFDVEGDATRLTMKMEFESGELLKRVVDEYGAAEGAIQMTERLEQFLNHHKVTI